MLEAVGSVPTNKYAEGYPGTRYYGGCEVDRRDRDRLAIDRAKELFGAEHANVQPHAGAQTNMAVYSAVLEPGRHDPLARAPARRPPHARAQGQLLREAVRDRPLRRLARDDDRRLRRGAADREGDAAEAHRLRRVGLPAHGRGGQASARSPTRWARCSCATWRTSPASSRRGSTPTPSPLRLRHLDDAQDARRAALRLHPLQGGARAGGRQAVFPGMQGGPLMPHRSRRRRHASRSPATRAVPRVPAAGPRRTPTRLARRSRRAGSTC